MLKKRFAFIVILSVLFFYHPVVLASSSRIFFSNEKLHVEVGDRVEVYIMVDTISEQINVVTSSFTYPYDFLDLVEIDMEESVFPMEIESYSPRPGLVNISRFMVPGTSFSGKGKVAELTFVVTSEGSGYINFTDDVVLANTMAIDALGDKRDLFVSTDSRSIKNVDIEVDDEKYPNGLFIATMLILFTLGIYIKVKGIIFLKKSLSKDED